MKRWWGIFSIFFSWQMSVYSRVHSPQNKSHMSALCTVHLVADTVSQVMMGHSQVIHHQVMPYHHLRTFENVPSLTFENVHSQMSSLTFSSLTFSNVTCSNVIIDILASLAFITWDVMTFSNVISSHEYQWCDIWECPIITWATWYDISSNVKCQLILKCILKRNKNGLYRTRTFWVT